MVPVQANTRRDSTRKHMPLTCVTTRLAKAKASGPVDNMLFRHGCGVQATLLFKAVTESISATSLCIKMHSRTPRTWLANMLAC